MREPLRIERIGTRRDTERRLGMNIAGQILLQSMPGKTPIFAGEVHHAAWPTGIAIGTNGVLSRHFGQSIKRN